MAVVGGMYTHLIAAGLGAVATIVSVWLATNSHGSASRLSAAFAIRIRQWPAWVRKDEWGYSICAIRLYAAGLVSPALLACLSPLPHPSSAIEQYIELFLFLCFAGVLIASSISGARYAWRSGQRWRYRSLWPIIIFTFEIVLLVVSLLLVSP
jgi:hypothetical protein